MKRQPTLVILVGNIGSGKSSRVKQLYSDCQVISRDEWRYHFGAGNYLFDYKLESKIDKLVKEQFRIGLSLGNNIVIDETNMDRNTRKYYVDLAKEYRYTIVAVVFPDLGEDEHVRRRMSKNHGDTPESTWREVYKRKQNKFQMPTQEEGFGTIIKLNEKSCYE